MTLRLDDYDFQKTAEAVYAMNQSARESFDSPTALRFFMESCASRYMPKTSFFGTYGFYLSMHPSAGDPDVRIVRATVSPSLVTMYLEKQASLLFKLKSKL